MPKNNCPVSDNEAKRLKALSEYGILNTLDEESFDRITELASLICKTPISLVSLVDENRQWFKSKKGLAVNETPRDMAFCQYAILDTDLMEVNDAAKDDRFKENALVTADPHIRFYAGQPLIDPKGFALGTLCVIDRKPRRLTKDQKRSLQLLAIEVTSLITERRQKEELRHFETLFSLSNDLVCIAGADGYFKKINPAFQTILGWDKEYLLSCSSLELCHPDDVETAGNDLRELSAGKRLSTVIHRIKTKSGKYKTIQWESTHEPFSDNLFCIGRDISSEKEKEQQLSDSEQKLRTFFENSQSLMCTHDLNGRFLSVNYACAAKLGYTVDELLKLTLYDISPPDRHWRITAYLTQIKTRACAKGEMVALDKNGGLHIWVYNNVLEIFAGNEPYVIGNATDVTEKHLLEKDLEHLRNILEQTGKMARVGGWEMDMAMQKVSWSAVTRQIHGVAPDFTPNLDNSVNFYKEGESREKISNAVSLGIAEGKSWDLELQIITVAGEELWVRALGNAEFKDGKCLRLFGTFQDIDKQKKTEIGLQVEKAMLSAFVEHTPAAIAMVDTHMKFIAVSKRMLEEYHIVGKEIIGHTPYEIFNDLSEANRKTHERVLKGSVELREEVKVRFEGASSDEFLNIELRPWYQFNNQIGGMMMSSQNITSLIKKREELIEAKLLAEQANIAKSEFLANMSHEIRTPLNGIIGFTEQVLKSKLDETQKQQLSIINHSSEALLGIINDILDFSKIEAGKLELNKEKCDLFEIIYPAKDIIAFQVQQKRLKMRLDIPDELPRFIFGDPIRIKQILINLLSNAAKFTEKGEIELKISILSAQKDQHELRFSVRDTGIGIQPEKQHKIFEAFSQENSSTTKKYGGTGLGLTISNKLLGMMGSHLQLESKQGEGSTFYFDVVFKTVSADPVLPIHKSNHPELSGAAQTAAGVNTKNVMVLIAEDNAINMLLIKTIVKKLMPNATLFEAKNGLEAIHHFKRQRPDIVLMDIQMPEMNGLDATQAIRSSELNSRVPIIALTAANVLGEKEKCLAAGMDDFITKPFAQQTIKQVFDQWVFSGGYPAELKPECVN